MGLLGTLGRALGSVVRVAAPVVGSALGPLGTIGGGVLSSALGGGGSSPASSPVQPRVGGVVAGTGYNPSAPMGIGGVMATTPWGNYGIEAGDRGSVVVPGWMWPATAVALAGLYFLSDRR